MSSKGPPRASMASMAGDRLPFDTEIDAHVEIDLTSARLARELRDSARQIIGLLPASPTAPVQRVARQVAIAWSRLTRTSVVILDPEAGSIAAGGAGPTGEDEQASHALFALRRIDPLILLCVPDHAAPPGAKAELLKLMLQHVDANVAYGLTLVDMSGLARPGEMLGAQSLVEGIIVVGHQGRTTEADLVRAARLVPPELGLGVVLGE